MDDSLQQIALSNKMQKEQITQLRQENEKLRNIQSLFCLPINFT